MNNNIEKEFPKFVDKAKKIQNGIIIECQEAEILLLQASLLESFFIKEHKKIDRQLHRQLKIIEAKMQLVDNAKTLFESCIKRH